MMSVRSRVYMGIAVLLAVASCSEENKNPPPAPYLEYVPSPTTFSHVLVSGSAQYGTTVNVARTAPPLGAGETLTAALTADPFTGRFQVVVPLALGADPTDNVFSFTATDAKGRVSAPAALTVVRETATVKLLLTDGTAAPTDTLSVPAGTTVTASVVTADGAAQPVEAPFSLTTNAPGAFVAGSTITGLDTAGGYVVFAAVAGTTTTSPTGASATLTVTPDTTPGHVKVALELPATAVAGTAVPYRVTTTDPFNNPITPTSVTVTSSDAQATVTPAGALGDTGTITHTRAGAKTVTATVLVGTTPLTATAPLLITPAAPATVNVTLTDHATGTVVSSSSPLVSGHAPAGTVLDIAVAVADQYGNAAAAPFGLTTNAPALIQGNQLTVTTTGTYSVVATVNGTLLWAAATFTIDPGAVATLDFGATPNPARAGQPVQLQVVARDAYGNAVPAAAVTLTSTPTLAASYTPPCTAQSYAQGFVDPTHFVAYDLAGVAGGATPFTLTAAVGLVTKDVTLAVKPAAAARFAPTNPPSDCSDLLKFTDGAGTLIPPTGDTVTVAAGAPVFYEYGVVDAYGNPTVGPVQVFTTAPNAQIVDDGVAGHGQIANLTVAGVYTLTAYIAGVFAPGVKTFTVGTAAASSLNFFLSTSLAGRNTPVGSYGILRDAFGNQIPCVAAGPGANVGLYSVVVAPAGANSAGPVTCGPNGTFLESFTFTADNTYTLTATFAAAPPVSSSAMITIMTTDTAPPTVTIRNVVVNGTPCAPALSPPVCTAARNDQITFDVVATDNFSLSQVAYSIFFQTTGSVRSRTFFVASNATLPVTVQFSFTVPGGAGTEDAPLVAMATDGAGNIATSLQTLIRVIPYTLLGGRVATTVAQGGLVNGPNDVAVDGTGNLFVANDGASDLLEIPVVGLGFGSPVVFSGYPSTSRYLTMDAAGNLYVSDRSGGTRALTRVTPGGVTSTYLRYNNGQNGQGLAVTGATVAKGLVDATNAATCDTVTVGAKTYVIVLAAGVCTCTPSATTVCVNVPSGGNVNSLLASAVTANSAETNAAYNAASCGGGTASCAVVAAKVGGEAGSAIPLATASGGPPRIRVSGTDTRYGTSANTLKEGHDEHLWLGQDGTGDTNLYRYPETLAGAPTLPTGNHGAYNVQSTQLGVAVRDFTTAQSPNVRDVMLYVIDSTTATDLNAYNPMENFGALTTGWVFNVNQVTGGNNFNQLYDVVVEPATGCLLVSDEGRGEIYTVDVRNRTDPNPLVARVASGLPTPRGLAFGPNGDLYVALNGGGAGAILQITPSPAVGDCF